MDDQKLLSRPDFVAADVQDTRFDQVDQLLLQPETDTFPWASERDGWRKTLVTIGIPSSKKATQASRREATAAQRRVDRHEMLEDSSPEHAVPGYHFSVPFHHRSLCEEIKKTFSLDPAARDFVLDPHLVEHVDPLTGKAERVFGELYNSQAFIDEDLRLQTSPPEPDCTLERVIVGLMFWSDATVVSQFGQAKAWPGYMFYANQSKYTRSHPSAFAAHYLAYIPSVSHLFRFICTQVLT